MAKTDPQASRPGSLWGMPPPPLKSPLCLSQILDIFQENSSKHTFYGQQSITYFGKAKSSSVMKTSERNISRPMSLCFVYLRSFTRMSFSYKDNSSRSMTFSQKPTVPFLPSALSNALAPQCEHASFLRVFQSHLTKGLCGIWYFYFLRKESQSKEKQLLAM